jgi:hypothetical protein
MNDPQRHAETIESIRNADAEQLNVYANICFAAGHPGIEPAEVEAPPPPVRRAPAAQPARQPAAPPAPAPAP